MGCSRDSLRGETIGVRSASEKGKGEGIFVIGFARVASAGSEVNCTALIYRKDKARRKENDAPSRYSSIGGPI
jgi:hypothetical protein